MSIKKTPRYIVQTFIFATAFMLSGNAFSFTSQRFASVEMVDQPGGIRPAIFTEDIANKQSQITQSSQSFSKDVVIQNNSSKATETSINADYVISKSLNNNVQLSLQENPSQDNAIKFKSLQAIYKDSSTKQTSAKTNKSNEAAVKLATIVTIPNSLPSGKYYLSLQFSALYE